MRQDAVRAPWDFDEVLAYVASAKEMLTKSGAKPIRRAEATGMQSVLQPVALGLRQLGEASKT